MKLKKDTVRKVLEKAMKEHTGDKEHPNGRPVRFAEVLNFRYSSLHAVLNGERNLPIGATITLCELIGHENPAALYQSQKIP